MLIYILSIVVGWLLADVAKAWLGWSWAAVFLAVILAALVWLVWMVVQSACASRRP